MWCQQFNRFVLGDLWTMSNFRSNYELNTFKSGTRGVWEQKPTRFDGINSSRNPIFGLAELHCFNFPIRLPVAPPPTVFNFRYANATRFFDVDVVLVGCHSENLWQNREDTMVNVSHNHSKIRRFSYPRTRYLTER